MWQRFSEYARLIIFHAQEEAIKLNHNSVSAEHLMLGLLQEPDCTAMELLKSIGINAADIRIEIVNQSIRGDKPVDKDLKLTVRAKRIIDLAYAEANKCGENCLTSRHLLMALVQDGESKGDCVLRKIGADIDKIRSEAANMHDIEIETVESAPDVHALAMNMNARKILDDIIKEYGTSIYTDHERCISLLWERRNVYTREIIALQLILQAGIVEELVAESETRHKFPVFDRLSRKACHLTPIDKVCALWAIITWAIALGIIHDH